jgi:hypothetical protein
VMCDEQCKSCQLYHTSHAAAKQTPMSDQPSLTITAMHTSAMPRLINRQLHFTSVQEMVCTIVAEGPIIVYMYHVPCTITIISSLHTMMYFKREKEDRQRYNNKLWKSAHG